MRNICIAAIAILTAFPCFAARNYWQLNTYDGRSPNDVLSDSRIGPQIRQLVGRDYSGLEKNLSDKPWVGVNGAGDLITNGCAPAACMTDEAKIHITHNGHIYVALLYGGDKVYYFTNHYLRNVAVVPEPMQEFIDRFPKAKVRHIIRVILKS